jgi:hypothetical protein
MSIDQPSTRIGKELEEELEEWNTHNTTTKIIEMGATMAITVFATRRTRAEVSQ